MVYKSMSHPEIYGLAISNKYPQRSQELEPANVRTLPNTKINEIKSQIKSLLTTSENTLEEDISQGRIENIYQELKVILLEYQTANNCQNIQNINNIIR